MGKTRLARFILMISPVLIGLVIVATMALPSQAVQSQSVNDVGRVSTLSGAARLASTQAQTGTGVIILNPFAGSSSSPVTANGRNWPPDQLVVINLVVEGEQYAVASAVADEGGNFEASFFIPLSLTNQPFVTVQARAINTGATATALYTLTDNTPVVVPTPAPAEPQGVVVAQALNVRSGPGTNYPTLGSVGAGQVVDITGINGDWYRIRFPSALGDYGWVSRIYINSKNADDVPVIQAPPPPVPTAAPTATPLPPPALECNPGQWSGCGGASCLPEYVSQCGGDGKWQQCVWDPGHCSTYDNDNGNDNGNDNDNGNGNNNNNGNDNGNSNDNNDN